MSLLALPYSACNFIICREWVSSENTINNYVVNIVLIQTEVRLTSPHVMSLTSGPTHRYLFKNQILQTPSLYRKIT